MDGDSCVGLALRVGIARGVSPTSESASKNDDPQTFKTKKNGYNSQTKKEPSLLLEKEVDDLKY